MGEVLVSVIVPVYNVEQYLDRCLKSITDQTYKNIEIILVDDGSPDNCPKICDDWAQKDPRIKVLHKENAGAGMARKSGFEISTGRYVLFVDSDDYVAENLVERCLNTALQYNADTVAYGKSVVYSDGQIKSPKNAPSQQIFEAAHITQAFLPSLFNGSLGIGVGLWSKMFSVDIIKRNNITFYSERDVVSEDSIFCLEYFSKASKVAVISDGLYFYRKNEGSLTQNFNPERGLKNNAFLEKSFEVINDLKLPQKVKEYICVRYHGFVLAFLMQIVRSDLKKTEKTELFKKIFRDTTLRKTLKKSVIQRGAFLSRWFWWALKFRCYFLCRLFLKLRTCV